MSAQCRSAAAKRPDSLARLSNLRLPGLILLLGLTSVQPAAAAQNPPAAAPQNPFAALVKPFTQSAATVPGTPAPQVPATGSGATRTPAAGALAAQRSVISQTGLGGQPPVAVAQAPKQQELRPGFWPQSFWPRVSPPNGLSSGVNPAQSQQMAQQMAQQAAQPAWPQAATNPFFPRMQAPVPRQAPAVRNTLPWGQPQRPNIVQPPPRQTAGLGGLFSMFRPAPAPAPVQQRPSAFSWLPFGNRAQPAPRGYNPYATAQRPAAPSYNPLSGLNPLNALNPLQVLNPLSALNPVTAFNPLKALNPVNAFNPLYAMNPVNSFNPLNALNPVNAFNPMYLMNPINALNPLNALNPGNQMNPLQRLNPLNAVNPLNGLTGLGGKYAAASFNTTTLKNLLGLKSRPTQRSLFGFGAPPAAAYRPAPPAPAGGGYNPFSSFIPGFIK